MPTISAMSVRAMSLNMPAGAHPNKMPFTGTLVPIGTPSDDPPNGTNGKKIILTHAAAEQALPSLLGMGVGLKEALDGHDPRFKVGVITDANIAACGIQIAGYIFSGDFPDVALAIQRNKADLGFSFEASQISVQSMADEILTITGLSFSGAAVLLRDKAAFRLTSLAASKGKQGFVLVHPVLMKALTRAGFTQCADPDDRLSDQQMSALMEAAGSVQARIELKQLVGEAGIWPKGG
jgi:hypothetical protein